MRFDRMVKKMTAAAVATMVIASMTACGSDKKSTGNSVQTQATTEQKSDVATDTELLTGKHHVVISIVDHGEIAVELDADVAPISVTNFVNLAKSGFYEGRTFHRIIDGFMMQGGAQSENETYPCIKGEFANNGVENNLKHVRGTISMARATDPNSASTQFFICVEDSPHLDGDYAAFGTVTSGMEIADKICQEAVVIDTQSYMVEESKQPVIKTVTVID